jgi:hypothetical protein
MEPITLQQRSEPPPGRRTASWRPRIDGTNFVIALYAALVLGTPAIVRFAPDADARWIAAITTTPPVHCAGVADLPHGCATDAAAASLPTAGGCDQRRVQTSTRSMPPAFARAT